MKGVGFVGVRLVRAVFIVAVTCGFVAAAVILIDVQRTDDRTFSTSANATTSPRAAVGDPIDGEPMSAGKVDEQPSENDTSDQIDIHSTDTPTETLAGTPTDKPADEPADGAGDDVGAGGVAPTDAPPGARGGDLTPSDELATVDRPPVRVSEIRPITFTLAATGDILLHSNLWAAASRFAAQSGNGAYDYRPMLAPIAPLIGGADLGVCHLETPIAPPGEAYSTYPLFGVQPEIAQAIAATGYDRCSTASNHALDRDIPGIESTIDALNANGVGQSGMAHFPAEIGPHVFQIDGVQVTHLSYTYSYNGRRLPAGQEWRSALIDPARIVADARAARALGAEVVIVSMHWGTEASQSVDGFQRRVANEITAPGVIDVVIGHHAHVMQPIEQVNGTWVMFGTGNVLSSMPTNKSWPAASQDAGVFEVDITVNANRSVSVSKPRVYPTWVDKQAGFVVLPVQSAIASGRYSGATLQGLQSSLDRTRRLLGPYIAPEP